MEPARCLENKIREQRALWRHLRDGLVGGGSASASQSSQCAARPGVSGTQRCSGRWRGAPERRVGLGFGRWVEPLQRCGSSIVSACPRNRHQQALQGDHAAAGRARAREVIEAERAKLVLLHQKQFESALSCLAQSSERTLRQRARPPQSPGGGPPKERQSIKRKVEITRRMGRLSLREVTVRPVLGSIGRRRCSECQHACRLRQIYIMTGGFARSGGGGQTSRGCFSWRSSSSRRGSRPSGKR